MRILVISVLFSLGHGAPMPSVMYGSLQSPNFPDPYPRETERRWNISVPHGFRVGLYFSHFHLEPSYLCEYDYVKVEAELQDGGGASADPGRGVPPAAAKESFQKLINTSDLSNVLVLSSSSGPIIRARISVDSACPLLVLILDCTRVTFQLQLHRN
ncbi:mannan-binding lectin serine protease 1-like [Kryptolebias marmoratus]|uniref:mannan-binding lectin serine protease 1-like n=1 Tax=Kryptolebias marmoratus TaxID=37003 RepID=UPI0018ACBC3D|nr:mannan-binding lectin serine protease 1-like [Kryptolebias marmoratus]